MYLLVDIIAIVFVLGISIYGLIAGFSRSTIGFLLVLICVAGAGALAFLTATLFVKIGWVTELQNALITMLGNSKISGAQEIIEEACYWIAFGIFTLIFFTLEYILLNFLRRLLAKLIDKFNNLLVFGFIDKVLGFIINLALSLGLVLVLLAVTYALSANGKFSYGDEIVRASEVLKLVYKVNPLNEFILPLLKF